MDSNQLFAQLKSLLSAYEPHFLVVHDKSDHYYVNVKSKDENAKPVFFGAVQVKKSYVSFHLMPIYDFPELVKDISPALKKRMQGKSCFNFKQTESELFVELEELLKRCIPYPTK